MATNWNRPEAAAASGTTYIVFLVLTLVGLGISIFLAQPKNVILPNGRPVEVARQPTWISEFKGLIFALRSDRMVILLFPFFLSSNWFYAYQFNAINGSGYFDIRGRVSVAFHKKGFHLTVLTWMRTVSQQLPILDQPNRRQYSNWFLPRLEDWTSSPSMGRPSLAHCACGKQISPPFSNEES